MGRLTDTEQIRIYCNNNPGGVLDLSYASKRIFMNIPIDNLRKYLSRLVLLRKQKKARLSPVMAVRINTINRSVFTPLDIQITEHFV